MPVDAALGKDTPAADGPGPDNLSSIAKAARVLRALAITSYSDARVTDLAALAALPKSTTHRILAELIGQGLVSRAGQRYRLDSAWFAVQSASASSKLRWLVEQARRPLISLHERTGATVHLAVLDGEGVLYLEKVADGSEPCARAGAGAQAHLPATCTAVGKALLAYADAATVRSIMSRPLPRLCGRSIVLPRLLNDQLREVRRTGLACDLEEALPGVSCVAAPVFRNREAIAAVSVARAGAGAPAPAHATEVRRAALGIAAQLTGV